MTAHPVPFTESDACWCQPFDGPAHPNCPMHGKPGPNILATIRMYRDLRNWSFQQARDTAIEEYRKKGWYIPASIEVFYRKRGMLA